MFPHHLALVSSSVIAFPFSFTIPIRLVSFPPTRNLPRPALTNTSSYISPWQSKLKIHIQGAVIGTTSESRSISLCGFCGFHLFSSPSVVSSDVHYGAVILAVGASIHITKAKWKWHIQWTFFPRNPNKENHSVPEEQRKTVVDIIHCKSTEAVFSIHVCLFV